MQTEYHFSLVVEKLTGEVGTNRLVTVHKLYNKDFTDNQLSALVHIFEHAGQDPVPPVSPALQGMRAAAAGATQQPSPADKVTQQAQARAQAHAQADADAQDRAKARAQAKVANYTGDSCTHCGSMAMKVSGHCQVCESCGTTTGCS